MIQYSHKVGRTNAGGSSNLEKTKSKNIEEREIKIMSITLNERKRAIEISKEFYKKSTVFNSFEYNEVRNAKLQNPTYRVCVKASPKRKIENRMTLKDMILYIEKHSGADSVEMKTLAELRGVSVKEAGNRCDAVESAKFSEIKTWFFATYPDLAEKTNNRQKRIDEILAEAAKNAASA